MADGKSRIITSTLPLIKVRKTAIPVPPNQAKSLLILGIETSCDESGVALYDTQRGLLGHRLHSQMAMHADYGGVVPELASRDHIQRVLPLTRELLAECGLKLADVDAIAYTQGPGLAGRGHQPPDRPTLRRCARGDRHARPWLVPLGQ